MQRRTRLLPALALTCLLSTAFAAEAQSPSKPTPVGRWRFETAELAGTCRISGEMTVWRTAGTDRYGCRFIAFQTCTAGTLKKIRTAQTCTAEPKDGKLNFLSKLERVDSADPESYLETAKVRYQPDNFLVALNAKGDEMTGLFFSMSEATVRFFRLEDLVS